MRAVPVPVQVVLVLIATAFRLQIRSDSALQVGRLGQRPSTRAPLGWAAVWPLCFQVAMLAAAALRETQPPWCFSVMGETNAWKSR